MARPRYWIRWYQRRRTWRIGAPDPQVIRCGSIRFQGMAVEIGKPYKDELWLKRLLGDEP